jgi:ribosomal-protein-alanine N-acetyltransferase
MNTKFAFDDFPVLQTERFTLRAAREQDSPDILALYSDERVAQYLPLDPFETMDDAMGELGWYTKIFVEKSGLRWMIEDAKSTKVIGTCGFLNREDVHNRAEIGYDLHQADPQNKGSIALLKKLGFQQEGLLREHEIEKGRYVDLAVFSLLKSEF